MLGRRLGLFFALACPLAAGDPIIASGWNHFYNLEYSEAVQTFEKAVAGDPRDPESYNCLAQALLYQELYRLGALESEILTGNDHFIRTEKIRPDPAVEARFRAAVEKSVELAGARLGTNPNDTAALYALGSAYGTRTSYEAMVQKAWRAAVIDISLARKYHNRVVELDPRNYDALLSQGVYDYAFGSLPWHTRLLSFLIGKYGDKKRGIETIRLVGQKGNRARVDAQVMLAIIYRREKQPAKAIEILDPLIRAYPRNYLFRMEKAHMYSDLGEPKDALAVLREVERMALEGDPGYGKIPLPKVYYAIGDVQFWYKAWDEALKNMRRVTRCRDLDLHTGVLAWMRQGQILDLTGHRSEAVEAYKKAIRFAPQTAAAKESRRYLSSPYKRDS